MRNLSNNTIIQVIQQIRHEIIYEWNHWKIHFFYFFLPCSGRKDSSTHSHYTLLCILSFFLHTTLCSVAQCILIILISYLDLNDNYWSLFWSLYHHHKSFFLFMIIIIIIWIILFFLYSSISISILAMIFLKIAYALSKMV